MSKNNDILSQIGGMYILYKLRWVIIIGIIILTIIVFSVKGDLDKSINNMDILDLVTT